MWNNYFICIKLVSCTFNLNSFQKTEEYHSPITLQFFISLYSDTDCHQTNLISNGFCNDETNNEKCYYDGGDCCGSCINTNFCTNCSCISNTTDNKVSNVLVGDGFCNDETNNQDCNFDGGDCCSFNITTDHCSECNCYIQETCAAGFHPLVNDGHCDDDVNIAECNFDDRDCCGHCEAIILTMGSNVKEAQGKHDQIHEIS